MQINNIFGGDDDASGSIGQIIQSISKIDPSMDDYKVVSSDGRTITLDEKIEVVTNTQE